MKKVIILKQHFRSSPIFIRSVYFKIQEIFKLYLPLYAVFHHHLDPFHSVLVATSCLPRVANFDMAGFFASLQKNATLTSCNEVFHLLLIVI